MKHQVGSIPIFAAFLLTLVTESLGYAVNSPIHYDKDGPDPICVGVGPESCQGVFKCDTSNLSEMECVFYVYDSTCASLHPDNPWAGVRAGDSFTFAGLDHSIGIENATGDLDKTKIDVVWTYLDGTYGEGHGTPVRGDCSTSAHRCAFMRSAFVCKNETRDAGHVMDRSRVLIA